MLLMRVSLVILFVFSLLFGFVGRSQFDYSIQTYGPENGLESQFVNDIFQDNLGYYWVATQFGVYLFDGTKFELVKGELSSQEAVCIKQSSDGAIWIGTNTNGLYRYTFNSIERFEEELPSNIVRNLFFDQNETLWISTSEGVVKYNGEEFFKVKDPKDLFKKGVLCVSQVDDGTMYFGTQGNGLVSLQGDKFEYFKEDEGVIDSYIFSMHTKDNNVYLGTTSVGVLVFDGKKARPIQLEKQSEAWISKIMDFEDNLLIVSSSGLFSYDIKKSVSTSFTTQNGLKSNDLYTGFVDNDKNIWVGWKNGVQCVRNQSVLSLQGLDEISGSITCIEKGVNGNYFFIGTNGKGIYQVDESGILMAKIYTRELKNNNVISLREMKNGELWVGASLSKGLVVLNNTNGKFTFNRLVSDFRKAPFSTITDIKQTSNGDVWFSLYNNGMIRISESDTSFLGESFGLDNGNIYGFEVYNNEPYVFLHNGGVFHFTGDEYKQIGRSQDLLNGVVDFKMDEKGNHFFATKHHGLIIEFPDGSELVVNEENGLLSNNVNSLWIDGEQIFVGTKKGLNVIVFEEDSIKRIIGLNNQSGLKNDQIQENSLVFDNKNLWICARTGVSKLNRNLLDKLEKSSFPINITNIQLFFEDFEDFKTESKLNRWGVPKNTQFNYQENHISFHYGALTINPVKYSYRIVSEGFGDWTKFTEMQQATFSNLQPGAYVFEVKAKDSFGNISETARFEFYIESPLWRKIWFQALMVGLLFLIGFGIFRYRVVRLNRQKRELEEIVQERTQEVLEVSKGLEIKNREILDSIEYAQRIQSAMLPDISQIRNDFSNAQLIYLPKDIVAGDFYWYDELNGYKMVAVADCTGHGVPGAMVSIVCYNALNRAVREFGLTDPGQILDKTREMVLEEFKEKGSTVNDGMDISLVSINHETKELKWAGANNPIWFTDASKTEIKEIKGDKQPIGHHTSQTPFTTQTLDYTEVDTVYLFSDGFPDQFGGERGKKLKSSVFRRKILELQGLELDQQIIDLEKYFLNWKGNLEQLDDVCVMTFKIN